MILLDSVEEVRLGQPVKSDLHPMGSLPRNQQFHRKSGWLSGPGSYDKGCNNEEPEKLNREVAGLNPHRQFVIATEFPEVSGLSADVKEKPEDTKAIPVLLGIGEVAVAGFPMNQMQLHRGPDIF